MTETTSLSVVVAGALFSAWDLFPRNSPPPAPPAARRKHTIFVSKRGMVSENGTVSDFPGWTHPEHREERTYPAKTITTNWLNKQLPAALLLVILWAGFRVAYMQHAAIPQPLVHDEFSYLLGADTFADGRLANPPHPLARFFESPHILVRAVYASKYPPGQALVLALGERLFGSPFYGVLIGNAFMLFALCLMLCAWVSFPWAMTISGLIALYLRPHVYWTFSYWAGSVAAAGAAFVLLGIGLCRRRSSFVRSSASLSVSSTIGSTGRPAILESLLGGIAFAFGAMLLFWTRPYEGGIFTLLVLAVFAADLWRNRNAAMLLGALAIFTLGGLWTGYYNWSVTGSPLTLPYLLHDHEYNVTPPIAVLPLRPEPAYSNPRLAAQHGLHGEEAVQYHAGQSRWSVLRAGFVASLKILAEPLGAVALLTLCFPIVWRNPVYRRIALVSFVFLLALTIETFHFAHYAAPILAALALMVAIWAESLWKLRLGKLPLGAAVVVLALLAIPAHKSAADTISSETWPVHRADLIQRLSLLNRPQLVIVRYPAPNWRVKEEWVYNTADIDRQRVIFAHDLGPDQDQALLNYYPDRAVSLLTFDRATGAEHLRPYPAASEAPQVSGQ